MCQTTLPSRRERQGRKSPILEQTSTPASTGSGTIRSMVRTQSRLRTAMGQRRILFGRPCHPTKPKRESSNDVTKWLQMLPGHWYQQTVSYQAFDCPPNKRTHSDPNLWIRSRWRIILLHDSWDRSFQTTNWAITRAQQDPHRTTNQQCRSCSQYGKVNPRRNADLEKQQQPSQRLSWHCNFWQGYYCRCWANSLLRLPSKWWQQEVDLVSLAPPVKICLLRSCTPGTSQISDLLDH